MAHLIPWGSLARFLGTSLVFPGLHYVCFTCFGFFVKVSALSSLHVLGHAWLACPWPSLERFLSALQVLHGALTLLSPPFGRSSFLGELHGVANRLFQAFLLEELIGLIKVFTELGRLDIPYIGIYFDFYTGCVGRRSWQTPVLTLHVLGHAWLACPWPSLERFLSALQVLHGALTLLSPPFGRSSFLGELHGVANRLFQAFLLEELIGLIKVFTELGRLDIPYIGIYFDFYTGCVGRRSWQTPVLILFDWQMLLVLLLLDVGKGEEITF